MEVSTYVSLTLRCDSANVSRRHQRSSTHTALFCHDILVEILACLSPGWFPWIRSDSDSHKSEIEEDFKARKVLRAALASCARMCRAFSDPALAELWRILDHHVLLLCLLRRKRGINGVFDSAGRIVSMCLR